MYSSAPLSTVSLSTVSLFCGCLQPRSRCSAFWWIWWIFHWNVFRKNKCKKIHDEAHIKILNKDRVSISARLTHCGSTEANGKISKLNQMLILSSIKCWYFCSSWTFCIHLIFKGYCCKVWSSWGLSFGQPSTLCLRRLPHPSLSWVSVTSQISSSSFPLFLCSSHGGCLGLPGTFQTCSYIRAFALELPLPERLLSQKNM